MRDHQNKIFFTHRHIALLGPFTSWWWRYNWLCNVTIDKSIVRERWYRFHTLVTRAPSQYPIRRLIVRSREVLKPRDWYFKLSNRFEIWQAHRQQCCRSACQISKRSDNSKYKSRGFETSRDHTIRRIFGHWDGAQSPLLHSFNVARNGLFWPDFEIHNKYTVSSKLPSWNSISDKERALKREIYALFVSVSSTFETRLLI